MTIKISLSSSHSLALIYSIVVYRFSFPPTDFRDSAESRKMRVWRFLPLDLFQLYSSRIIVCEMREPYVLILMYNKCLH